MNFPKWDVSRPAPVLDDAAARKAIRHISALDLSAASVDEIAKALEPVLAGYTVTVPRIPAETQLFRGRIGPRWETLSEIKHPPAEKVDRFGRLNRPGRSLMYMSSLRAAVAFELAVREGEKLVVAEWRTTERMTINSAGYTAQSLRVLGSNRTAPEWAENHQEPANRMVQEFLDAELTRRILDSEENRYKVTAAIGEKMFAQDGFDGFLYPTVAMRGNADNIALKPSAAESKLRFHRAEWMRVTREADSSFDIEVLDTATQADPDGRILWRGRGDVWVLPSKCGQVSFNVEDGRWVARDRDGAVIEPG